MGKKISNDHSVSLVRNREEVEAAQALEAAREIHASRERLGRFTVGYMTEAVYGEEFAAQVRKDIGDELYETKMSDVKLETKVVDGGISTKLSGLDKFSGEKDEPEKKEKLNKMLDRQEEAIDINQMLNAMADMSDDEMGALMKLARRMKK